MLKKALFASAILASGVAFANGGMVAVPVATHTCNCYVGVGISADALSFDTDANLYATNATSGNYAFSRSFDWAATGVNGEIFVGTSMMWQDQYTLGLEAWGSVSSAKGDFDESFTGTNAASSSADIKMNGTVGIAFLPGIKLSDSTTGYVRVGWAYSRFKVTDTVTASTAAGLNGLPVSFSRSKSGIQLGVGMETMVTCNVGIRGEYDWYRYSRIDSNQGAYTFNGTTYTGNFSSRPTVNQFTLAATYHFYS